MATRPLVIVDTFFFQICCFIRFLNDFETISLSISFQSIKQIGDFHSQIRWKCFSSTRYHITARLIQPCWKWVNWNWLEHDTLLNDKILKWLMMLHVAWKFCYSKNSGLLLPFTLSSLLIDGCHRLIINKWEGHFFLSCPLVFFNF